MTNSLRIRLARWLLRGTGYHLRAGRKPKMAVLDVRCVAPGTVHEISNVEPVHLTVEGNRIAVASRGKP